jgi:hypothetical protein
MMLWGVLKDMNNVVVYICYKKDFKKEIDQTLKMNEIGFNRLSKFLGKKDYLTGKLTIADLAFHEIMDRRIDLTEGSGLNKWPNLITLKSRIEAIPEIATYRKSKKFIPEVYNNALASWIGPPKKLTLGYWDIRGLAEPIRVLLGYLEVPYIDFRYDASKKPYKSS